MPAADALQSAPVKARRGAAKPDLFTDPMPARIEPCLALLQSKAPTGRNWAFEVKWDGYRLAVHRDAASVRVITRGGRDWTHRFPSIAAARPRPSVPCSSPSTCFTSMDTI